MKIKSITISSSTTSTIFVYLAGNHNSKTTFRTDFNKLANPHNIKGIDPFERNVPFNADNAVGRDLHLINNSSYIICETSKGGNMSTGTAMESVIAKSLGKKVICLVTEKEDFFPDNGVHPFTHKFADYIASNIKDAVSYILSDITNPSPTITLKEQIESFGWDSFPKGDINVLS